MKKISFSFPELVRHLLLGWLLAAGLELALLRPDLRELSQLTGVAAMSLPRLLCVTAVLTAGLGLLSRKKPFPRLERWCIIGAFALLMLLSLPESFSPAYLCICLAVLAILIVYALRGHCAVPENATLQKCRPIFPILAAVLAVGFFGVVSVWTVCRYWGFSTPSYDFGIFAQMFHSMRTTGLPVTTLERRVELSHFAVHVSPIYYLMLPFYCLFPDPATLQILQAAVMASAVIPLWLIARRHGLSGLQSLLVCLLLLLLPANAGGAYYDLHENCFLLPLILWLLYAMEKKSLPLTAVFALLTLFVKEDAAVYVAVAGLFFFVSALLQKAGRRELLTGLGVTVGAIVYFLLVTAYLSRHGDGVMSYRYKNFMYDGSGSLFTVVKAVLLCPMKMLFECVDGEKLEYIGLTLLPLLGLPLLTRRYERYILLIPYLLINLMSDYPYQHSVLFQYNFGSTAFLIYLLTVNLAELRFRKPTVRPAVLLLAVTVAAGCLTASVYPSIHSATRRYTGSYVKYDAMAEALQQIPEDAAVTASTFYTSHLSQRKSLYDIDYVSARQLQDCDYVILSARTLADDSYGKYNKAGRADAPASLSQLLEEAGFLPWSTCYEMTIYKKG